jgi:hypothetical protein
LNDVDIYTTKETWMTVGKDMKNSSFIGENLHTTDTTYINVAGSINYSPYYTPYQTLSQLINAIPFGQDDPIKSPEWDTIFGLLVNPNLAQNLFIPDGTDLKNYFNSLQLLAGSQFQSSIFPFVNNGGGNDANPGFIYNAALSHLGFGGQMGSDTRDWLNGWNGTYDSSGKPVFNTTTINNATYGKLYVIRFDASGLPVVQNNHLVLDPVTFVSQGTINALYTDSLKNSTSTALGMQIGGPGKFDINAGSLSLGNSQGIISCGIGGTVLNSVAMDINFNSVSPLTDAGASVEVNIAGNLDMLTSRIASLYGGDVSVNAGGNMNLGSQEIPSGHEADAYGIYTTGVSDVNVTANGNIDINGSRIAAFNGGNVFVESFDGNVSVGSGGNTYVDVPLVGPASLPGWTPNNAPNNYFLDYQIYGSGIVATSLPQSYQPSGLDILPGNITVKTPRGDIVSSDAGILQYAQDGSTAGGPTITLEAGTPAQNGNPAISGNIDLGHSGIIGGTVNLTAQGNITGLVISRQDSSINSAGNFSGTLLSAGSANVSAGGSVSGTIIGVTGANVTGSSLSGLSVLSQNANANGTKSDSLGTSATGSDAGNSAAGANSQEAARQVASNDTEDDEKKKKDGKGGQGLVRRNSRVRILDI